jgi:hypothetical protein
MDIKIIYIIPLWYLSILVFSYTLLDLTFLKKTMKNYVFCYAVLIALTGLFADGIIIANKPFPSIEKIKQKFPKLWFTDIHVLDLLDLGPMIQHIWELYSVGNINYQNAKNWTWNYEIPHLIGNVLYVLSILFLLLKQRKAFLISLLFASSLLCIDYTFYIISLIVDHINNVHIHTAFINKFISWGCLDFPYMFFAGYYIFWYAYTECVTLKLI